MTAIARTLRSPFAANRLGEHWPIVTAILLALVMGWTLGQGQLSLGLAVVGLLILIGLSLVVWLPLLVVVLAAGSFAEFSASPQISFPGPDPYVSEILFAVAFIAWGVSPSARAAFDIRARAVGVAMAVLVIAIVGGAFVGISQGATPEQAIGATRPMLFYAIFWPAVAAFRDDRIRRLTLLLLGTIATSVVFLQIAQGLAGKGTILFYVGDPLRELLTCPESQCTDPGASGFPRVRPPGMPLVYVAAIFGGSYVLWGPRKRRVVALAFTGLMFLGVLISLNRNMIVGLALGLAVATLATPSRARIGVALVVACLLAVTTLPLAQTADEVENPIAERVLSLTDLGALTASGTVRDRVHENDAAVDAIRRQPITGIGWGTSYGQTTSVLENGTYVTRDQAFIHQQYLGLWLRTGLAGLVAFIIALGAAGFIAARSLRRGDDSWLAAAVLASLVAVAFSSTAMILLMDVAGIVVVASLVALGATLRGHEGARAAASV